MSGPRQLPSLSRVPQTEVREHYRSSCHVEPSSCDAADLTGGTRSHMEIQTQMCAMNCPALLLEETRHHERLQL